jgi:hypothetical protein
VALGASLSRNRQPLLYTTNLSSLCSGSSYDDCGDDEECANVTELLLLREAALTPRAEIGCGRADFGGLARVLSGVESTMSALPPKADILCLA